MYRLVKLVVGLLSGAVLAACSVGGSPTPASIPTSTLGSLLSLTAADTGRTLAVPVGGEIDVKLQTIGPGQYGTPQVSSAAVRYLSVSLVSPYLPAGPTQLFRFEAVAHGQATVSIQSTEGHNPAFTVTINSI